ncbi:hypothetical protein [Nakamurella sp.]|uniref:hypothetical protein n=1 Tax=Nakamurella sp. TaxID=1869182 RepID=UPI0037830018
MTADLPAKNSDHDAHEGPDTAGKTVLDGPALENEQMRRGTEDLRSSQDKTAQAREFADDVARTTEPEPPARPGDES